MNKIMLIGNLGRDPEMNYTPSGTACTKFSIAVSERRKNKEGNYENDTTWFNIIAWNKIAEICGEHLKKGSKVFVEGKLVMRKYTDKNGVDRMAVEVNLSDMEILTPKPKQQQESDLGELEDHPF